MTFVWEADYSNFKYTWNFEDFKKFSMNSIEYSI